MTTEHADDKTMAAERASRLEAILSSGAAKKVIVAGPGTGKSFTFKQVMGRVDGEVLVLSFLGNLVRDLQNDLGDRASVRTFHSYSRGLLHNMDVAGITRGVDYFPNLASILDTDVRLLRDDVPERGIEAALMNLDDSRGIASSALRIGDYYNAVGHTDAVYRVYRALEANPNRIPKVAQLLVDEYQDFSLLEASLIGLLAETNPTIIAGDDDQALYGFKHASADYLRDVVGSGNWARFELPYCTRCTQVLVDATHRVVNRAQAIALLAGRIDKQYICYLPEKREASLQHPKIIHARCTVERNPSPYMCNYVTEQIRQINANDIATSHAAGHPTVLIVAPPQFAKRIHSHLANEGVPNLSFGMNLPIDSGLIDGYRRLIFDERSRLGWRLVLQAVRPHNWDSTVRQALLEEEDLVDLLPEDFVELHLEIADLLRRLLQGEVLDDTDVARVEAATGLVMAAIMERLELLDPDVQPSRIDDAPTVAITSLLGAKGLQAEHVFVMGLNDQHFPRDNSNPTEDEVCALLVALTRARKSCTLVSCDRFGAQSLAQSVFIAWLAPLIETIRINAAYFRR